MLQAHEQPYSEETCASIPQVRSDRNSHQRSYLVQVEYEFPNGYHDDFGVDRFKISEALFDPSGIR